MSEHSHPEESTLQHQLAPALQLQEKSWRRFRALRAVAIAGAILLVVVGGALLLVLQVQSRDIAKDVESCITPGGACYERSTAQVERTKELQADVEELRAEVDRVVVLLCAQQPDAVECEDVRTP